MKSQIKFQIEREVKRIQEEIRRINNQLKNFYAFTKNGRQRTIKKL
jgi:uncharacterized protein (UPF0335 family)